MASRKMNKLLGKLKKLQDPEAELAAAAPGTESLLSESDSLKELQPMFVNESHGNFTNDTSLNLNPSISAVESLVAESSLQPDRSLFSSRVSHSTRQSSYFSNTSSRSKKNYNRGAPFGQTLQILEASEDTQNDDVAGNSGDPASQLRLISDKLHVLWQDISFLLSQYTNSVSTLSTTVIGIINFFEEYIKFMNSVPFLVLWSFNSYNNDDVRRILKTYLHFYDNLLQDDAYVKLKLLMCKTFNDFNRTLKSTTIYSAQLALASMTRPCNYAIGVNDGKPHKNEGSIRKIMAKISSYDFGVNEQNGSFIAPIARGISKDMNVLCLYFGYRTIGNHHSTIATTIQDFYDDIHVIVAKNRIELGAATVSSQKTETFVSQEPTDFSHKFKLPFRTPLDPSRPPMSLSLSTETSARISGTMGGFIYPIIDKQQLPHLRSYANSKFAISCGHVCLETKGEGPDYPYISSPLAVLISLYKHALLSEHDKFSTQGYISRIDSHVAYSSIINQIDELFPMKKVKSLAVQGESAKKNLPKTRFGQIIWGERTLIQAKNYKDGALLQDKRLSDLAIIKVNKMIHCDQNYLGDDVAFNEFDPSLMFENLYVRRMIDLRRHTKESELNSVREVDSMVSTSTRNGDGTFNMNGIPVFKYGSTTKFTKGNLNGIKLVYWMDGAIHSSEFVVNSAESTTSFAAGGDSGAWILTKLEDVRGSLETKGLGVAGMLHSYDGESRQFGLFTPMTEILERLEEVTKIKWGVVGVPEKHDNVPESVDSSDGVDEPDSESSLDSESDSDYESLVDEEAFPPELD
ncbi:peptidase S64 [Metschnikowia bicuspidata var. bicuspidata NRRL YB-4993]|uniref:Peptidase S64 n=1 Tax=Metschnikowia bicuspidata var. bicuspidata NRRL YB-4993 TaxID=869754 RepID=A0A1A0H7A9_9ASCO|nr:peptidase S64 [Metschnikowia bicuspidata var. bicuspidata NRRL YB-4993]OBA19911.1 peptidase S64 [Metschnikowia bicuspidata var. bicuspidata NRRL YB-4993]